MCKAWANIFSGDSHLCLFLGVQGIFPRGIYRDTIYLNNNFLNDTFIPDFSYYFLPMPLSYGTIKIILIKPTQDDQLYWFSLGCPILASKAYCCWNLSVQSKPVGLVTLILNQIPCFSLQFYSIFYNCLIIPIL